MVQRNGDDRRESGTSDVDRIPHDSGNPMVYQEPARQYIQPSTTSRPSLPGSSHSQLPRPSEGGTILPSRCQGAMVETQSGRLQTLHGTSTIHPQRGDGGGIGGETQKHCASSGGDRSSGTDCLPCNGRGQGLPTDAMSLTLVAKILRELCPEITARGVTTLTSLCQRIIHHDDFQRVSIIRLTEDDNLKLFIDTLLSEGLEEKDHPHLWTRAVVLLCYFDSVYKMAVVSTGKKEELFSYFVKAMAEYNIPWRVGRPRSLIGLLPWLFSPTALNRLVFLLNMDVNRIFH